jgi:Mg-chelatase subunit ChlD
LQALDPPNGGTDFDPPLHMAKDLMEKYQNNYDSFVLVMMSDGEADYPSAGV